MIVEYPILTLGAMLQYIYWQNHKFVFPCSPQTILSTWIWYIYNNIVWKKYQIILFELIENIYIDYQTGNENCVLQHCFDKK